MFDTVDHQRLEHNFGVVGRPSEWFRSLSHRQDFSCRPPSFIVFNLPVGMLCTARVIARSYFHILFILYTAELRALTTSMQAWVSHYTHTQTTHNSNYCTARRRQLHGAAVAALERCLEAIRHSMAVNRLELNTDKTEVVWLGSLGPLSKLLSGVAQTFADGDDVTEPNSLTCLLGVTMTSVLLMDEHVSIVCTRCF